MRPCFLLLALLITGACAGGAGVKDTDSVHMVRSVPFFPQEAYQCGPASLAGALGFLGLKATPSKIAKDIYSSGARGVLNIDLVLYAQRKGLQSRQYRGGLEDLKRKIDSGTPVIVMTRVWPAFLGKGHFMLVKGYSARYIIANSGRTESLEIPVDKFMKAWRDEDYWTLLITK